MFHQLKPTTSGKFWTSMVTLVLWIVALLNNMPPLKKSRVICGKLTIKFQTLIPGKKPIFIMHMQSWRQRCRILTTLNSIEIGWAKTWILLKGMKRDSKWCPNFIAGKSTMDLINTQSCPTVNSEASSVLKSYQPRDSTTWITLI